MNRLLLALMALLSLGISEAAASPPPAPVAVLEAWLSRAPEFIDVLVLVGLLALRDVSERLFSGHH